MVLMRAHRLRLHPRCIARFRSCWPGDVLFRHSHSSVPLCPPCLAPPRPAVQPCLCTSRRSGRRPSRAAAPRLAAPQPLHRHRPAACRRRPWAASRCGGREWGGPAIRSDVCLAPIPLLLLCTPSILESQAQSCVTVTLQSCQPPPDCLSPSTHAYMTACHTCLPRTVSLPPMSTCLLPPTMPPPLQCCTLMWGACSGPAMRSAPGEFFCG